MSKLERARWKRVTNAYIVENYKQEGCSNCDGKGFIQENSTSKPIVCSCAVLAFRRDADAQVVEGRLRVRNQRIENRDVSWFEYREIGAV